MKRIPIRILAALTFTLLVTMVASFFIMAASCGDGLNPGPNPRGIYVDSTVYVEKERHAMLLFQSRIEDKFGVDLGNVWETASVEWVSEVCNPTNGNPGIFFDIRCYAGIMWSCDEMYVAVSGSDPGSVCKTSLIHEFAHCLAYLINGDTSPGHIDPVFDEVKAVADETCRKGW